MILSNSVKIILEVNFIVDQHEKIWDVLQKMIIIMNFIQAEKESVTDIITGIKNYISQSGIANNLNVVQYLLRGLHWIPNPIKALLEEYSCATK